MYNKQTNRTGSGKPSHTGGWKGRKVSSPSRNRGRNFSGNTININQFIKKAAPQEITAPYAPRFAFADFAIHPLLKKAISRRNYDKPTAIQDQSIPPILEGRDVLGLANTGTGKTGAFLIPMINKMLKNQQEKMLVVVPTRELAIQIQEEFVAFTKGINLFSVVVVGGADIQKQIRQLRLRHNVIVGTPGRLKDLIARKQIDLSKFANVVLDEADQMLDMGFINDVKLLLSLMTKKRQTLLFSATLSPEIESLINNFLTDPLRISVKTPGASTQVEQDIVRVQSTENKIEVLHDLLIKTSFQKVLIFSRTKHGAEKLSKNLHQRGFKAESIHGDKSHAKRQRALKLFKENHIEILVATDVASRGLDIPNVSHVINYDVPATYDDYIHRIGRTGRADKTGIALTFIN